MQSLERVQLFRSFTEYLKFFTLIIFLFFLSLSYEYYNYTKLQEFDTYLTQATVLKQYTKTKTKANGKKRSYQVLKLKSEEGFTFYTIAPKKTPQYVGKKIELEFYTDKISFYDYLRSFFAFSHIRSISQEPTQKEQLASTLDTLHTSKEIAALYKALFIATPLPRELQQKLSDLGVSHLLALSGFHLSVLFALLFFLLKYPYTFLQQRYFPYRSKKRDLFFIIAPLLGIYLLFVDLPPSLLRAYAMLIIVFILYDRGVAILSMQTLLIVALLLLAFFPRLLFSVGFFLSLSGVFYIFLFLHHFSKLSKIKQFLLLPLWIYIMMLPFSLAIFGNFSLYHPLSILWTTLFSIFYPLTLFLHIVGLGDLFDGMLEALLSIKTHAQIIPLPKEWLALHIALSFLTLYKKELLFLLLFEALSTFVYAVYYVTKF